MKKIIIVLIVIIGITVFFVVSKSSNSRKTTEGEEFSSLCYYQETPLENGPKDKSWLRIEDTLEETGMNTLRGEFYNLPAEKDSKVGTFAGEYILDETDPMFIKAMTLWQSQAEGTTALEELAIKFNPQEVLVGFGEMKDRGDGIYVYTDKNSISYTQTIPIVSCEELDERIAVEKYVRENIATISDVEPVLGGSWYVVSLNLDVAQNTGSVVYEDGHIQETRNFSYQFVDGSVTISLVDTTQNQDSETQTENNME